MTEKLIRATVDQLRRLQKQRTEEIEASRKTAVEYHKSQIEAIQKQCRHRKRSMHSGYELQTYWTCDICDAEVARPKA